MSGEMEPRRTKGSVVYPSVIRALAKLGSDISLARRARRIQADAFARSMGVSRATLHRLEHGDPGISLNTLAMALSALGRLDLLSDLMDQSKDVVGMMVMRRDVPTRVQNPRRRSARGEAAPTPAGPVVSDDGPEGW